MEEKEKITLDEIIGNHFDKDYPDDENMTDEDSQFVGSMYDVYKKGFTSALNMKSDEVVGNLSEEAKVYRNKISELENKVNELSKPDLSLYKIDFLNWLDKYFIKSIKVLRYKSKTQSNKMYTLHELEQKFNKAYKENPYKNV